MHSTEPVYFEFPEFKSSSRRDYWLDICLEILRAHRFIRKYNLRENQVNEALARAILGIFRYRAIREALHVFPSNYRTLLCFNLAESLPGGDMILETLSNRLAMMKYSSGRRDAFGSPNVKKQSVQPFFLLTLCTLGIMSCNEEDFNREGTFRLGEYCAGEISPLEAAVKESKQNTGRAVAAQATVDQVKVEGIDTNLAVLKELLYPLIESFDRLQHLVSWEDPWKSGLFLLLISYTIFRGWTRYILPCTFLSVASFMIWRRQTGKMGPLEAFKIVAPPTKNAVEQLLTLQDAVTQVEGLIQSVNIVLLKMRALLYGVIPQATEKVALMLVLVALALAFVPLNYILLFAFVECFTRNMPLRKESSARFMRRTREWWLRIPAAPVELIKSDDKKRR
ncbi:OLC1v1033383C1 [Oldenlandia corymbosa var. corymbosa]|uniref:OLC1v1033383C1 n=1 Tax=Oldenlandia corymbosa var. corymbosa TaxID=529605 RepID=A0AAV1CR50_OLDCO|nr:OLC1v1033383C1 [Oldenlandia corymbosa var. corymbosa]